MALIYDVDRGSDGTRTPPPILPPRHGGAEARDGTPRRRTSNPALRYPNRPHARALQRQDKGEPRDATYQTRNLVTRASHGEERTRGSVGATTRNLWDHGDAHARLQARARSLGFAVSRLKYSDRPHKSAVLLSLHRDRIRYGAHGALSN
jgi:hypothetical protein